MNRKKANEEASLSGFKTNDEVFINNHFFANHGMAVINIGMGIVQGTDIGEGQLPKLLVKFPAHPDFFRKKQLHSLLEAKQSSGTNSVLVSIYPGYLGKIQIRKTNDRKTRQITGRETDRPNRKGQISGEPPKFS